MAHMPKPVLAAVEGPAAGAGFSLALACDLIIASEAATFTVAYTAIGLPPDGGLTSHLTRLVGPKIALELTLSNRRLSAPEARSLGLVAEIVPPADLDTAAHGYAQRLASGPTQAFAGAKRLFAVGTQQPLETQLESERQEISACGNSGDFAKGVDAFLTKRTAAFTGN